jgi:polyphenol oxidase
LKAERVRKVTEELAPGELPLWRNPEWTEAFPWLVQGTTGAGSEEEAFDLGLFGSQPVGEAMRRWRELREGLGFPAVVHARQVHGGDIAHHRAGGWGGLLVTEGVDGHLTGDAGILLTVSIADCIPLAVVDGERRSIALVHAGWRGVAAGIADRAIREMRNAGSAVEHLTAHAGPAICGRCYEVGPEVHRGVNPHLPIPEERMPIDLHTALAERLLAAGLDPDRVTVSTHCTLCGPGSFFSHRGGSAARQMSVLGRRS